MGNVTTIGLDIAKSVFQVHGVDAAGEIAVRKSLRVGACWHSSRACRDAWSGLRRAVRRIIGLVN
jgi:hypothetical protein